MSTPNGEASLSRAVSEIDLNAALKTLKDGGNVPRKGHTISKYSPDDILSLRTGLEKNPIDYAEFEFISKPNVHGTSTLPLLTYPRVPPPTPATPNYTKEQKAGTEVPVVEINSADGEAEKKKKKKKSSGKNKKPAPTGFEEFYADSPMTPEEHDEETLLYGELYPFDERIQQCIQRYRARRKLDETRSNILTKYLTLGGVESGNKAFTGGLDKQTIQNSTAAEIAAIQATDYVRTNGFVNNRFYDGSKDWVVDFEGVAKGFFSYRLPKLFVLNDQKTIETYVAVIRNFLNYVLLHAVCPEYTKDVMAAKKVCDMAEKELWATQTLQNKFPGEFNLAASIIHGGQIQAKVEKSADGKELDSFEGFSRGLTLAEAERIYRTGICLASNDDGLFDHLNRPGVRILKTDNKSYEVVAIERADEDTIAQYSSVKDAHGNTGTIKPLGVLRLKPWVGAGNSEVEHAEVEITKRANAGADAFWLEDEILELCYVGLKLELTVHELDCGWKFFDSLRGIYCSFYTYLNQEKMTHWKEPWPSLRPPPTEDDPYAEERAEAAEAAEAAED